jgi:hypothetical protein
LSEVALARQRDLAIRFDLQERMLDRVFPDTTHADPADDNAGAIRRKVPLSRKREFGMTICSV